MRRLLRSDFLKIAAVLILFSACTGGGENHDNKIHPDSAKSDSVASKKEDAPEPVMVNRIYNDIARFIAGMPQEEGSSLKELESKPEWVSYSKSFESNWNKLDSGRFTHMRDFAGQEFAEINKSDRTVFYPFSGPDFLNVYTFFPTGKEYYMLGLEPAGSVPSIDKNIAADSLNMFFNSMNKSLYAILNYSFFRTISMAEDLKTKQLHGTLPIMMLFITRTGNTILDVEEVTINSKGM